MSPSDVVLILLAIILAPFALRALSQIGALVAIPFLEVAVWAESKWRQRQLRRDTKKAEALGASVYFYRLCKKRGATDEEIAEKAKR